MRLAKEHHLCFLQVLVALLFLRALPAALPLSNQGFFTSISLTEFFPSGLPGKLGQ
jgi:hypothetical protein